MGRDRCRVARGARSVDLTVASAAEALTLPSEAIKGLTTASPSESANEVFALMRRFNQVLGTTFLIVTHDTRIAAHCERVIELVDGRVQRDESRPR